MKPRCNCRATIPGQGEGSYHIETFEYHDQKRYVLYRCPDCSCPVLMEESLDMDLLVFYNSKQLFPTSTFHVNSAIPEKLQGALLESIDCFNSASFTATVIMCRRLLEGFCHMKGVNERSLFNSIKTMKDRGLINDQLVEWANLLKDSGNEAAHSIDVVFNENDAKDILEFAIGILDFTYSFQEKFDNFQKRRSNN